MTDIFEEDRLENRFEQSLTKAVIFGLRIGERKYENELKLVHNNCRIQIRGNHNKNIDKLSVIMCHMHLHIHRSRYSTIGLIYNF